MIDNKYVSRLSKQLDKRLQIAVHFLAILSAVTVPTSSGMAYWKKLRVPDVRYFKFSKELQKKTHTVILTEFDVKFHGGHTMQAIQCRLHNAPLPVPTITDHTGSVPSFRWCLGCWISRHFSGWPCACLGWLQVNFRVRKGRRLNQTLALNPFLSMILHFHLSIWVICPWKKLEASVGPFYSAP